MPLEIRDLHFAFKLVGMLAQRSSGEEKYSVEELRASNIMLYHVLSDLDRYFIDGLAEPEQLMVFSCDSHFTKLFCDVQPD